jgi:phospholipid transport system transporter-binding protein
MGSLSGELSFATAGAALAQGRAALAGGTGPLALDLGAVTRTDSAGLALLLELLREARTRGRELTFANAPAQLRRLAGFFGVAEILALPA